MIYIIHLSSLCSECIEINISSISIEFNCMIERDFDGYWIFINAKMIEGKKINSKKWSH